MSNVLRLPDILLYVIDHLCELEFENYREAPQSRSRSPKPRSLKGYLHSVTQVCKSWRTLTMATPTFWVTRISISLVYSADDLQWMTDQIDRAQELLDNSANSDLDIHLEMPYDKGGFDKLVEWLDTMIFPLSHRIRIYRAGGIGGLGIDQQQLLLERFQRRQWPRLRVMKIESVNGDTLAVSNLQVPRLRFAKFAMISWKDHDFRFSGLSALMLNGFTRDGPNFLQSPGSYILPSSHSLTFLTINCNAQQALSLEASCVLHLPQLLRLSILLWTPEEVWKLLNVIQSQKLKELHLKSVFYSQTEIPFRPYPKEFHLLEKLYIHLPASWFLPLFDLLPIDGISTLFLLPVMEDEPPIHAQRRQELTSPIRFKNLSNLRVMNWLREDDPIQWNWFRSVLDLGATTNSVYIECINIRMSFPHARKLRISQADSLLGLSLPSLRHLSLEVDYTGNCLPHEWKESMDKGDLPTSIPLSDLDTLELDCQKIREVRITEQTSLRPFSNVRTLVLRNFAVYSTVNFERTCRLPLPRLDMASGSEVYLPMLNALYLIFPNEDVGREMSGYYAVLNEVREFYEMRRERGCPLRSLQLSFIPHSLLHEEEIDWFHRELVKVEVVKFTDEFESDLPL
jgi:hypothetical protein